MYACMTLVRLYGFPAVNVVPQTCSERKEVTERKESEKERNELISQLSSSTGILCELAASSILANLTLYLVLTSTTLLGPWLNLVQRRGRHIVCFTQ
jgi:hypothetical protein